MLSRGSLCEGSAAIQSDFHPEVVHVDETSFRTSPGGGPEPAFRAIGPPWSPCVYFTNARLAIQTAHYPLPHRIDCGCFARRQVARNRRHARDARDRLRHADAEFARAPGGDVYVRGTAASVRDEKADWLSESPALPRQLKASTSRGVGNANLSDRTKGEEYAGYNDDKRIAAATRGCDEWTVEWRRCGNCVYTRTGSGTGSGSRRPVRSQ